MWKIKVFPSTVLHFLTCHDVPYNSTHPGAFVPCSPTFNETSTRPYSDESKGLATVRSDIQNCEQTCQNSVTLRCTDSFNGESRKERSRHAATKYYQIYLGKADEDSISCIHKANILFIRMLSSSLSWWLTKFNKYAKQNITLHFTPFGFWVGLRRRLL
jgi:hypothetical protein